MNALPIVMTLVDGVVSAGAGAAVGNVLKQATPPNVNRLRRFTTGVGSVVLAAAAGNVASNYAQKQIVETVDQLQKLKQAVHPAPIVLPDAVQDKARSVKEISDSILDKTTNAVKDAAARGQAAAEAAKADPTN